MKKRQDSLTTWSSTDISTVERRLLHILKQKEQAAHQLDPTYGELLHEVTRLIMRGGKRLRPRLVLLAYHGLGGTKKSAIVSVAASQELLHAYLLMHDDIIDRDLTRWGGPNIIGRYSERFKPFLDTSEGRHFAEAWSLLAGDICAALSQELLLTSNFNADLLLQAVKLMQHTLFNVIGGELVDSAVTIFHDQQPTMQQLMNIAHYKTATYSFIMPLQLGALFAGANATTVRHIKAFGKYLGIAYQLTDDLLGMFGEETVLGKPLIGDLREGKQTILIALTLAHASTQQKRLLKKYLGNPAVTNKDLVTVQKLMIDCGAPAETKALAQQHVTRALASLPKIGLSVTSETELRTLAHHVLERQS